MEVFFCAFLSTLIISCFIVWSNSIHGHFTNDHDFHSVQKFHVKPVPRIGGLALLLGLFLAWVLRDRINHDFMGRLLLASLPIFAVGMLEDITKKVSAKFRLYISFLSAALVYLLLHVCFTRIDWPWFDHFVLGLPMVSLIMTLLVIGGSVHALNLIDGFNGLMLGVSLLMFAAIAGVSYFVKDFLVFHFALVNLGAILGLFIINFPFGKIFAGDSGAYFIGFLLGVSVLMLVQRNQQVSAWFPCLLIIYPIVETLFSIYRKVILRKMTAMQPDGVHLHMLVYKRIVRHQSWMPEWLQNSMTSPYLWGLSLISIVPAVIFWNSTLMTMVFCILFLIAYLRIYWYLVLFKDQIGFLRMTKWLDDEKSIIKGSL